MSGKSVGTVVLPKEIFGQTTNKQLLATAIRVYKTKSIKNTAHTKTRGEVRGGGKKPWRQKGTGNARAGSIRSPLWVGGGTTFGPRYREAKLTLPQKMRRKALIHALSQKAKDGDINIISNLEKISTKTKPVANLLKKLNAQKNTLLIISSKNDNVKLATRNIQSLTVEPVSNINAYQVLQNNNLLISKEALGKWIS
ncbi:50S ribosomal protein L4 [Candidatus Curtissbacteria bacterium RIFCSPHIGHO2_01_FULL_41_11]|uniref:Large ribosomal subunit protein uL4 n=1 Tax=Candidatus Curtissbacteria bacterium RIFCSPHIGHO2_01_FULL_41_11 TaxID=1797711 RepID=A0A1F5G3K9_9BACT|nr:MAG: 50S ribosomal protein L4 [Candidatus Curtissbacteria bacterium RIFCSPHIGHO2_01_FULL_41_11]